MSEPKITIDASSWNRVVRERDEAREELRTAVQERHDFHWELQDAIRERNEAREELRAMARKALEGWQ